MKVSISGELFSRNEGVKLENLTELVKSIVNPNPDKSWILTEIVTKDNKLYLVLE